MDPTPWERQEGESAKAFAAFQRYRDQPTMERSLRRLAVNLDRSLEMLGRWSKRWRWVHRVTAWDAEQDRLTQELVLEERRAFAKRLAASGALMQAKGISKVRSYIERIDRDGQVVELRRGQMYIDALSVAEAARLIETGARLEALGRGLPTAAEESAKVGPVTNPIVHALTVNPGRTAEAREAMERLMMLLGTGGEPTTLLPEDVA